MRKAIIGGVLVVALALAGFAKEKIEKDSLEKRVAVLELEVSALNDGGGVEKRVAVLELQVSALNDGVAADIGVLDDRTINLHERLMILESGPVRLKAGL